jgi:hypothetical protein
MQVRAENLCPMIKTLIMQAFDQSKRALYLKYFININIPPFIVYSLNCIILMIMILNLYSALIYVDIFI